MARETPWEDEYTLLCERCGYIVEGLDTSLPCPECGKPIEESLPGRRVGTPWQQSPGFRSLFATWYSTLRHPLQTLDVISANEVMDTKLVRQYLTIATVAWLVPSIFLYPVILDIMLPHRMDDSLMYGFLLTVLTYPLLRLLTHIECEGLVLLSKQRKTRVTHELAQAVTAHGVAGWALGFVLAGVILIVQMSLDPRGPLGIDFLEALPAALLILGGFLFFETFAWLGLSRLKYANRVRPQSESTEPETPSS